MSSFSGDVVLDTSVVVKFFIEESDSTMADALLEKCLLGEAHVIVLDFLFVEFVNVLWFKARQGELTLQEAEEKIEQLQLLSSLMEIVPAISILREAFQASTRLDHSAYDTALLALAESRGVPFVTADKRFHRKARPHSRSATLLSDLRF